tara:strand:+ start:293 stop:517 length:225 start_codon:yes stop_codon:yes gene_type:complete
MKYFILLIVLFLTACSLDKNSSYWNEDPIKKSIENKNLSKILKKTGDFKEMTFNEFDLFLKDYTNKTGYPDINN